MVDMLEILYLRTLFKPYGDVFDLVSTNELNLFCWFLISAVNLFFQYYAPFSMLLSLVGVTEALILGRVRV